MKIPLSALAEPFYEGSVQRLFAVPGDDSVMVTQTTARGSVFDVGALFEIPGHDVNRAVFRHVLYTKMGDPQVWQKVAESIRQATELDEEFRQELLQGPLEKCIDSGAPTHHAGMLDGVSGEVATTGLPENPSAYNIVKKFQILKPARCQFSSAHLFDYSQFAHEDGFVIPLEYIVRFGITSASSVYKKYLKMAEREQRTFEKELGVNAGLQAWQYLEKPISDFTSKFEPEDRMVSKQEALTMSGLPGGDFVKSAKMAILGAWVVRHLLEEIGLLMWDIKWEFAKDGKDLVFVDTIDTDSFRATAFLDLPEGRLVTHYNKQAMRDYFSLLHGDWIEAIGNAKKLGQDQGVNFTAILEAGQKRGEYPQIPDVDEEFISIQEKKMTAICDYMLDRAEADEVKRSLKEASECEVDFYRGKEKLSELLQINGV